MKFYELQQDSGGGRWHVVGYFRKHEHAELAEAQFNTMTTVKSTKIIERRFTTKKEIES